MNELDWKQPALVGGLIAGFLSVIPGIGWVNYCCCAWLLVGGAIAAKMLINRTPRPVKNGEGAQIGAIAGLIAAGVFIVTSIPLTIFAVLERIQLAILDRFGELESNPAMVDMRRILEESINMAPGRRILTALPVLFVAALLFTGFSTLGGLLGVALFEKRKNQPPPQYPPSYPPQYPAQYPSQYPSQYPGQYPPDYPQQSPPSADYPSQNPPQSGGSSGDQGVQGGQGGWPKE